MMDMIINNQNMLLVCACVRACMYQALGITQNMLMGQFEGSTNCLHCTVW